jgi:hypothetical protein
LLPAHDAERFPGAQEGTGQVRRDHRVPRVEVERVKLDRRR